jgi:hypothetical protein
MNLQVAVRVLHYLLLLEEGIVLRKFGVHPYSWDVIRFEVKALLSSVLEMKTCCWH